MNKIKTKILWCWVSWGGVFGTTLLMTLFSPDKIKFWGVLICLIYWIGLIVFYIREYNGLKDAVFRRFPAVHEIIFKQSPDIKEKYKKIDGWDTNSITSEMYQEDLNIKNRVLKLKELDFFRIIVFASLIIIMIASLFIFS